MALNPLHGIEHKLHADQLAHLHESTLCLVVDDNPTEFEQMVIEVIENLASSSVRVLTVKDFLHDDHETPCTTVLSLTTLKEWSFMYSMLLKSRQLGATKFLYKSSSRVYPANDKDNRDSVAGHAQWPTSFSDALLQCNEVLAHGWEAETGMITIGLRHHYMYGFNSNHCKIKQIITDILDWSVNQKCIKIPLGKCDFVHVLNAVYVWILAAATKDYTSIPQRVFNVSSGTTTSLLDLYSRCTKLMADVDQNLKYETHSEPEFNHDIESARGSITKIKSYFKYSPIISLNDTTLARIIKTCGVNLSKDAPRTTV